MPVVGSSAYNTAGQILTLVRSLLNDSAGNLFTDAVLIPYLNSAYRKTQRALSMAGQTTFKVDDVLLTVPAVAAPDPSVQVGITDATAPPNQLPTDLLEPDRIWERPSGSTSDFIEMVNVTNTGGLPPIVQAQNLQRWEWRTDGIYFVGALKDVQIRLRYKKALPDLVDASSSMLIRNAQDAIAYMCAGLAALARGSPLAGQYENLGEDALENLIAASTRQQQFTTRRRRPFSLRRGLGGWAW